MMKKILLLSALCLSFNTYATELERTYTDDGFAYTLKNAQASLVFNSGDLSLIQNGKSKEVDTYLELEDKVHQLDHELVLVNYVVGNMYQMPRLSKVDLNTAQVKSIDYDYPEVPSILTLSMQCDFNSNTTALDYSCENEYLQPGLKFNYRYRNGKIQFLGQTGKFNLDTSCKKIYNSQYLPTYEAYKNTPKDEINLSGSESKGLMHVMDPETALALIQKKQRYSYSQFKTEFCD